MATKKPKGLGLGLEALLGPRVREAEAGDATSDGAPRTLRLDQLQPGRFQPRTRMDEGALYELAESIKAQGVMQQVLVRPLAQANGAGAAGCQNNACERRVQDAWYDRRDCMPRLFSTAWRYE